MDLILHLSLNTFFFFSGLAFFMMGIIILAQPKKGSTFKLADILWLLACFGLSQGINEWLTIWVIIEDRSRTADLVKLACLIISFIFLFEFGKRLLIESFRERISKWQKEIANYSGWLIYLVGGIIIIFGSISEYPDFWKAGNTWARYLLGFPGALLTGIGFFSYYLREQNFLKEAKVTHYFLWSASSFIIYGILSGLVVPKGDIFPSNWLNNDSFLAATHMPVQAVRAVLAIIITVTVAGMIRIFEWETKKKLELKIEKITTLNKELESFAYSASHDLKEPLRVVAGFVGLLERRYKDSLDEKAHEYIKYTIDGTKRMQELISDLLEYSKVGTKSREFRSTDCSLILSKAILDLKAAIEESCAIVTYDTLPTILADSSQLTSLFQNLVGNAIKYRSKEALSDSCCSREKANEWVFSVRDNGIGIDPKLKIVSLLFFSACTPGGIFRDRNISDLQEKIAERHGGKLVNRTW
jgi:signal transduction histidine kinase